MKSVESEREDNVFGGQSMAVFVERSQRHHDFDDGDEDVEELVPVENSSEDDASGFDVFWAWYGYFVSLILGFTYLYLAPGAVGFELAFHFGILTTLPQGLAFMAISILLGIDGLITNLVTNSRRAAFAPLRLHLDEHIKLQRQLGGYHTHLLEHLDNLHDEADLRRYSQCFAIDPIIEIAEGKIRIMRGDGIESKRDRVQRRYLDKTQWGYLTLSIIGIVVAPVSVGGLICFLVLTPNAMVGQFIPIPDWAFNLSFVVASGVGIHAFVSSISTYRSESANERDLIKNLALAELKTESIMVRCRTKHERLNQVLVRKALVNEQDPLAVSDWTSEEPITTVAEFALQERGRATYTSAGFFGQNYAGRALFPIRPKPPKRAQVEIVNDGEQDANRNDRGFG